MKRKLKKRTITFHLDSLNTKRPRHMTLIIQALAWKRRKHEADNSGAGVEESQT
jgi:hypothetical protein